MPPVGFEPTISARERPQTYALDRAATGTDNQQLLPQTLQRKESQELISGWETTRRVDTGGVMEKGGLWRCYQRFPELY